MIKITRFFMVNLACIPLFAVAYFTESLNTLLLAYSIAAVHELFHLFAALLLSVKIKSIIIMPFGVTLRLADSLIKSPSKEIAVAISGPFANLVMIAVAKIMESMYIWSGANLFLFVYLNAIMFFINLLPCMPLDGGRVFKAFFVGKIGYINTVSFQRKVEKVIICILGFLGLILLIITKLNISLVMIAAFLAFNMVGEENKKNYIMMRELTHYKDKLKNRKYMQTKYLTAREDIKAGELLRRFGYDSFYIVNVADENLSVRSAVTEADVVSAIERHGFEVPLWEIVENIGFDNALPKEV